MLKAAAPLALVALTACQVGGSFGTQQGYEPVQPVAFSHALHAGEYRIDCSYCHTGVERSRHAGIPALSTCMNCHSQVKKDSPEIQKLAAAAARGESIRWIKVHRLPDFAWFSHANHVAAGGQACATCHGEVDKMVRIRQVETMNMGWCLSCHRTVGAAAAPSAPTPPTDCAACHF
jgi:hypothetical protein